MSELLRIWEKVERIPIPAGVDAEWRELLGDDLPLLTPYLMPEQRLATSYPCPHPVHDDCPRRVVHHGPEDIVAVCGNASRWCESLKLSRRDLVVYSLKTQEWIAAITEVLRQANGLTPLDLEVPAGAMALGSFERRGRRLAVVWIKRGTSDVEHLARGLRFAAGGDGLIAVLPASLRRESDRVLSDGVILLTASMGADGRLRLHRALDLLDPGYRAQRPRNATAIFDEVRIEFAEEPGVRHVVRINGEECGTFQKSDLKFLRLLLLAGTRAVDPDVDGGGWLEKFRLYGDENDHDLEEVRRDLRTGAPAVVAPEVRAALIKSTPNKDGRVRLAVEPTEITFDPSLAEFTFLGEQQSEGSRAKASRTRGHAERAENFSRQQKIAKKLHQEWCKLGLL